MPRWSVQPRRRVVVLAVSGRLLRHGRVHDGDVHGSVRRWPVRRWRLRQLELYRAMHRGVLLHCRVVDREPDGVSGRAVQPPRRVELLAVPAGTVRRGWFTQRELHRRVHRRVLRQHVGRDDVCVQRHVSPWHVQSGRRDVVHAVPRGVLWRRNGAVEPDVQWVLQVCVSGCASVPAYVCACPWLWLVLVSTACLMSMSIWVWICLVFLTAT